jgi:hypothetical protein
MSAPSAIIRFVVPSYPDSAKQRRATSTMRFRVAAALDAGGRPRGERFAVTTRA